MNGGEQPPGGPAVSGSAVPGSGTCPRPARIGAGLLGGHRALVAVATTAPDLHGAAAQARAAGGAGADVVELRLDLLDGPEAQVLGAGTGAPQELAAFWHEAIGAVSAALAQWDTPVLATARSVREGGGAGLDPLRQAEALERLIALQAQAPGARRADAVDIELSTGALGDLAVRAQAAGLSVVASSHDFSATPPSEVMLDRLVRMQEAGADCAKIAVMPCQDADVERTLGVAAAARARLEIPVVVIAMGQAGRRSRLEGWRYGSALTFATVGVAQGAGVPSAPGQPTLAQVRAALG